eukprot:2860789-Amphidinium_carterae.1
MLRSGTRADKPLCKLLVATLGRERFASFQAELQNLGLSLEPATAHDHRTAARARDRVVRRLSINGLENCAAWQR